MIGYLYVPTHHLENISGKDATLFIHDGTTQFLAQAPVNLNGIATMSFPLPVKNLLACNGGLGHDQRRGRLQVSPRQKGSEYPGFPIDHPYVRDEL